MRRKGRKLSLRDKIIPPMLAAALLPVIVFALMMTRAIDRSDYATGQGETDKLLETLESEISSMETEAVTLARTISSSQVVRNAYRQLTEGISLAQELDYYRMLNETILVYLVVTDVERVRVFLPESKLLTHEQSTFYSIEGMDQEELPDQMVTSRLGQGWGNWKLPAGTRPGDAKRLYRSYWVSNTIKGKGGGQMYVAVDVSVSRIQQLLLKHNEVECTFQLLDSTGQTVLQCGETKNIPEARRYMARTELSNGLTLCLLVDIAQFQSDLSGYLRLLLYISVACALLTSVITSLVLNRQCRDLSELAKANLQAAQGHFQRIPENATVQEVLRMQRTYNEMATRIDDLIHNVYEQTLEKQEAQLNCLFEQIKPHFLYNTLESGKWMAIREGDRRTAQFLQKLSRYFRVGLSSGAEQVPLRAELEHISLYVELINMRIADCVTLLTEVEEDVMECPVLRFLIQPIVENAVEHGICAKQDGRGTVRVSAHREGEELIICVENDGVGIPETQLEQMNQGAEMGLGISNVRKRMELYYGPAGSSIRFENREEGGVRTWIRLHI